MPRLSSAPATSARPRMRPRRSLAPRTRAVTRASTRSTACAASPSCSSCCRTAGCSGRPTGSTPTLWLRPLFRSGNFAVTVFLVAAGLPRLRRRSPRAAWHGRAPERRARAPRPARRPSLWLCCACSPSSRPLDRTDDDPADDNADVVPHVLTYTWNWYVQEQPGHVPPGLRPPLVPLGRHAGLRDRGRHALPPAPPPGRAGRGPGRACCCCSPGGACTSPTPSSVFQVLVRTTARMDPFVVGALVGRALPYLHRVDPGHGATSHGRPRTSLLALVPLMWFCADDARFLRLGVTLLELDLALPLRRGRARRVPRRGRCARGRSRSWAATRCCSTSGTTRSSSFVNRHTDDWAWPLRTPSRSSSSWRSAWAPTARSSATRPT